MGEEQQDQWDAGVEAAWTEFRGRLADAIAGLAEDEVVGAALGCLAEGEPGNGAAPYVQFLAWGEGLVRAEAVSNTYLDPAYALELEGYDAMISFGWSPPTYFEDQEPDTGSANFWLDSAVREADRMAWMAVAALRDVYGCVHPSFLSLRGWREEVVPTSLTAQDCSITQDEPVLVFAADRDELHDQMVRAVGKWLDQTEVNVDDDGDVPIRFGDSVLFVRVLENRPAIDVFAEIVIKPENGDRLGLELDILNRTHRLAKFYLKGETVVMRHRLVAAPFVSAQLKVVLDVLSHDLDELAGQLVQRVGGHRFLDLPQQASPIEDCPPMVGLLELMETGRVASSTIVEVFEHDRREIVRMIVAVRTGVRNCGEHDEEDVLEHLRRGLDLVARQEARATRAASRLAAGGVAQQLSLLDPEATRRAHRPRPQTA